MATSPKPPMYDDRFFHVGEPQLPQQKPSNLTADEEAAYKKLKAQGEVNPTAASGQKYDPLAYLQQQLEQYAQQFKPKTEAVNKQTEQARKAIADNQALLKQNEAKLNEKKTQLKDYQTQFNQLKPQYEKLQSQSNNAWKNYQARVKKRDTAIQTANDNSRKQLQKRYGTNIFRWPATAWAQYSNAQKANKSRLTTYYSNYINTAKGVYDKAAAALSPVAAQYRNLDNTVRSYTNAVKNLDNMVGGLNKNIAGGQMSIQQQQQALQDIDKQIEAFKPIAEGPKTQLGANISGTKEQAIQSAKDAAKNIAASQSDVDKGNLQNLMNEQADKIAKTFGLNPDEVKNQLQASEAFKAAGTQMPTQMTADQFKNYMGQAVAQQGPELQAKKLEASQVTGGTAESQQRLAEHEAAAQQQASASNVAREQTQQAYEQSEQQRQQALEQAKQAAQGQFAQQQKEYFTTNTAEGGQFHQMASGGEATSGFQQAPQQQFVQQPVQQIPTGKIGQFQPALQNAIKSQAAQGFQGALNTVKPDQMRPQQPPQPLPSQQQPQMMGNVQRGLTPQPQQRAGLPPTSPAQAGSQTRMPGQQKGAAQVSSPTPSQQVTFGNRYQPPIGKTSPAQQQTQQAIQQRERQINQQVKATGSEAQKQAMGLAKTPTSVMAGYKQKTNPYDKGQNVQMGAKELNVNREAGMRMPR